MRKHSPGRKKPTVKEVERMMQDCLARNDQLERQLLLLRLDIEARTIDFLDIMWTYQQMMQGIMEGASTMGEARRWYADYESAVNSVELGEGDVKQRMWDALAEKGFHITKEKCPDHHAVVNFGWDHLENKEN